MNVNVDSFVFSLGCLLLLLGCEFFCQFSFCSDGMLLVLNVFCMQSIFLVFLSHLFGFPQVGGDLFC